MCGASAKTLRFYDEIGLFRPAKIDPRSRYRFYSCDQLREFARIQSLRDCGASLQDIRHALARGFSKQEKMKLLEKLRRTRLDLIELTKKSLVWIDAALNDTEPDSLRVSISYCKAVTIASVRADLKQYEDIHACEQDLLRFIPTRSRGTLRGVLWHRCADGGLLEGEAFAEVKAGFTRPAVRVTELAGAYVARAFSSLDDDEAENVYVGLSRWIRCRGYRLAGARREIYRGNLLEIQYPVASR